MEHISFRRHDGKKQWGSATQPDDVGIDEKSSMNGIQIRLEG
jgi:hypothetical protein